MEPAICAIGMTQSKLPLQHLAVGGRVKATILLMYRRKVVLVHEGVHRVACDSLELGAGIAEMLFQPLVFISVAALDQVVDK